MKNKWIEKYLTEAEDLIMNDQVENGLNLLNTLLYEEPGYGALHSYLGWAYLYYDVDVARAEMHFGMAMKFDPEYAPPYLHMANLCRRAHRYSDALNWAEQGMKKPDANKVALYEVIGNVCELKGEYSRAIKAYKSATMNTLATFEVNNLADGIRRCRKKRVRFLFTF